MRSSFQKILVGTVFFTVSCCVAIVGYVLAGWTVLEAVYMVIITIFGVGYGEVRPIDEPTLRVFTIGVIIAGCTSSIYVIGGFVQLIAEGELNKFLGARRMTRGIENLDQHVIVCGYGRVGHILTSELKESGVDFVIVDTNQERLQEAETAGLYVLVGDATEEDVLLAAGIKKARVLATVLPDDAANVYITLTARELNEDVEIIARGESPSAEKKLIRSGATRVVLPAAIGASRIARLITRPSAEDLLADALNQPSLAEDLEKLGLSLTDIDVPDGSDFCGSTIQQLSTDGGAQFVVVAIRSPERGTIRDPAESHQITAGETLVVMAKKSVGLKLQKKAAPVELVYRGAKL